MNKDQNLWVDLNLFNQPSGMGQIWEALAKIRTYTCTISVYTVYYMYIYCKYIYIHVYSIYAYIHVHYMYMSMPYPNLCCPPLTQKRVTKKL